MANRSKDTYPVFVMCGSDPSRRKLLRVLDPEQKYKSKALLPFMGKCLIEWQLEALRESPYVEDLYLIGLSEDDITFNFPVHYVPSKTASNVIEKFMDGLSYLRNIGNQSELIVVSTSDTPAIQTRHINEFFEAVTKYRGNDFILSVVPEETIKALFPQSGRVVGRFTDYQVFPGELYALSPKAIQNGKDAIQKFSQIRRDIDRERRKITIGPVLLYLASKPQAWTLILKYLLKRASLQDAEKAFSKAFNCRAKAVVISDPGFGMDMDLPVDYERLKLLMGKKNK